MKSHVFGFALFSVTAIVASPPAQASGTLTRTFVSLTGVDTNPCTTAQPCATFAAAYAAVATDGIVTALDPGKYGPLTITGAVTIDGNGWAAITAPSSGVVNSGAAITVNAQSGTVHLRGLTIDGAGTGLTGISYNSGYLIVENCVIRNLAGDGIDGAPLGGSLAVSDTVITSNSGSGISVTPLGPSGGNGAITAVFNRNQTNYNGANGILVEDGGAGTAMLATITDSVAASNNVGFSAHSFGGNTKLMVSHSVAANDNTGVLSNGGATVLIGDSALSGNQVGWGTNTSSGILSYGTNQVDGNSGGQGNMPSTGNK
jgi:hypothetical protein